jgi:hypothetical protein
MGCTKCKNGGTWCDATADVLDEWLTKKYKFIADVNYHPDYLAFLWGYVKNDRQLRKKMNDEFIREQKRYWKLPPQYQITPPGKIRNMTDQEFECHFRFSTGWGSKPRMPAKPVWVKKTRS